MPGLNRNTGQPLDGFASVVQSIDVIFTTKVGERVMRRWFGCDALSLLGRLLVPRSFLLFATALATALDLWEPRFRVVKISPGSNSVDEVRLGHLSLVIEGEYRPRAHLGDFTPEGIRKVLLAGTGTTLSFASL